jgi:hypothetical protein
MCKWNVATGISAMIAKTAVKSAIDAAELEFRACFETVVALAKPSPGLDNHDILGFQMRLLEAISQLEVTYRVIKQEEKRLIKRKISLNLNWFTQRMATLARYSDSIRETLAIGRAIGDGFAWLFYERDRDLVAEHLKLQPQMLLPPALGAVGEKLTLKNMLVFDGKLLIYHGTTSFLRIGDISFIDVKTMKVACIGELKTQRIDDESISVSMMLVSGSPDALPNLPITKARTPRETEHAQSLPPAMQARLQRQRKTMQSAVLKVSAPALERVNATRMGFHYDELSDVVERSHGHRFEWAKAGNGLMLGAVRLSAMKSLSDRFFSDAACRVDRLIDGIELKALEIVRKGANDNSLLLGSVGGDSNDVRTRVDGIPFILWPIDTNIIRDILFGRVIVMSLFNPAHIWQAVRDRGFEVELDDRGKFLRATKRVGRKEMGLENLNYFLGTIHHSLMTEEAVIGMIDQMMNFATERLPAHDAGVRVEIRPRMLR